MRSLVSVVVCLLSASNVSASPTVGVAGSRACVEVSSEVADALRSTALASVAKVESGRAVLKSCVVSRGQTLLAHVSTKPTRNDAVFSWFIVKCDGTASGKWTCPDVKETRVIYAPFGRLVEFFGAISNEDGKLAVSGFDRLGKSGVGLKLPVCADPPRSASQEFAPEDWTTVTLIYGDPFSGGLEANLNSGGQRVRIEFSLDKSAGKVVPGCRMAFAH